MKTILAFVLTTVIALSPVQARPWQLAGSDVIHINAADGHRYKVMIAWPEGTPPPNGWPILWLLDGEDNFAIAALTARRLSRAAMRSGVEPGLIVAIESGSLGRRVLDYTPNVPGYAIPPGTPAAGLATGGADQFLDFLEKRVAPQIYKRWSINTDRSTLIGHSFGGMLAIHALANGRRFSRYVAISPSVWFGNGFLLNGPNELSNTVDRRLMISMGDMEGGPMASLGNLEPVRKRFETQGVSIQYKMLMGQTHGLTMLASMADSITFAFAKGGKQ